MTIGTRSILEHVSIPAAPERVFQALVTPTEICRWWSAITAIVKPETNGIWTAAWGEDVDRPDYITACTLSVFEPPDRLIMSDFKYYSLRGPLPFKANIEAEFQIQDDHPNSTLSICQSGFPMDKAADEFFEGCRVGWRNTLASIANYFER